MGSRLYMSFFSWLAGMLFPVMVVAICLSGGLLSAQVNANYVPTAPTACGSLLVGFTDLSSGSIACWEWDSGSAYTSNSQSPATHYSTSWTNTVTPIVSDDSQNGTAIRSNFIQFFQNPVVPFSTKMNLGCQPLQITFTNSSTTGSAPISTSTWDFGDGNGKAEFKVAHTNNSASTFTHILHIEGIYGYTCNINSGITSQVTNFAGSRDLNISTNTRNTTTPNGTFFFAPELICEGDSAFFTFIGDPGVVPTWYFGDGDSAVGGDTIWHQYTTAGIYTPQVLMTDSLGATAFTPGAGNVQALPLPQAVIWADTNQLCRYDTLQLADSTSYIAGPGTVDWIFGDGTIGSGSSISHFYSNSGTYDIIMNVTDALGCRGSDTLSNTIRILGIQADFYADDTAICNPQTVQFSDTSSSDTTIVAWSWSFGDGNTGVGSPTTNTYTSNDLFDVSLIVTDAAGCMDTVTKPKFIQSNLPEVPQIYAASVAGDDLVAINVAPTTNPLFKEYEVYGVSGPGSYFYIDNGAHINNGLIFDDQSNTLYASICYRALTQDVCDNKSDLDSALTHCTMELTAIPTNDAVDLVWSGYIGWDTILRYDIMAVSGYDTATANVQYIGSVSGNTTSFTDSSFVCSERRIYRIRAIGSISQEISWSDTSATRPILTASPEAPEIIVATVQNNADIQIDWAPGNLVGHTAYDLERSLDNSTWTPIGSFPNTTLQFLDQQVDVATQSYYYRISAIDACGLTTPYSNLGQSILLNIDASGNTPVFQWNAYQEWGAIDHYEIEEQPSAGGSWSLVTSLPAASNSYTHTQGSQNAGGTCYRIRAFEFGGNQAISTSNEICFGESLWIPNTLTPNGDGLNDVWIIQGLSNYESAPVDIYNRWGNLIYESSEYQNDWLGTNSKSNETLPDGTYFYVLKLSDGQTLRGQVTIMR